MAFGVTNGFNRTATRNACAHAIVEPKGLAQIVAVELLVRPGTMNKRAKVLQHGLDRPEECRSFVLFHLRQLIIAI